MGSGPGPTRDQVFLRSFGTPPPTLAVDKQASLSQPPTWPGTSEMLYQQAFSYPQYFNLNVEIWKPNFDVTNQGRRGSTAQHAVMMIDPRNNPSRSQFVERYTAPIQLYASNTVWPTPAGYNSKGRRNSQPSLKVVSPFSVISPIPTRMPWDL